MKHGEPKPVYLPVLKCLFFILDWEKADELAKIFTRTNVRFHFIAKARGTASSDMLNLLGLGSGDKALCICIEQDCMAPALFREVSRALGFYRPGTGIAFSVPLSGINNPLLGVFKESAQKEASYYSEKENENMNDTKYELIVTVANQGYSDAIMATAREAGAGGGTVVNARGLMHEGPVKFFGISVQEEKEIIIILAEKERKRDIMQALCREYGVTSEAAGLVLSLPVDMVMGFT
ncbi:MAG: hypothetical protein LBS48_01165 [Treponema sp.]|jgi:hypothetical protein|nr:hypothetical protein [Treponema sp.]